MKIEKINFFIIVWIIIACSIFFINMESDFFNNKTIHKIMHSFNNVDCSYDAFLATDSLELKNDYLLKQNISLFNFAFKVHVSAIFLSLSLSFLWFLNYVKTNRIRKKEKEINDLQRLRNEDTHYIIQGIVHELRSPISGMLGMINVTHKKYEGKIKGYLQNNSGELCEKCHGRLYMYKLLDVLNSFNSDLHKISDIITNLSDYDKKLNQKTQTYVRIKDVINSGIKFAKFTDVAKRIPEDAITYEDLDEDCLVDPITKISPAQCMQILQNLISNSIQAICSNPNCVNVDGRIKILVKTQDNMFSMSISDNGIGMTSEEIKKCTERYYTTKANDGGTGLGLHFIDKYIRDANGSLTIESIVGSGTIITVSLPVYSEDQLGSKEINQIKSFRSPRFLFNKDIMLTLDNGDVHKLETIDISKTGLLLKANIDLFDFDINKEIDIKLPFMNNKNVKGKIVRKEKEHLIGIEFIGENNNIIDDLISS